jgi:hypothetical protein
MKENAHEVSLKKPASPDQYFSWMNIQQHIAESSTSRTQSGNGRKNILFSMLCTLSLFLSKTQGLFPTNFQNGRGKLSRDTNTSEFYRNILVLL